MLQYTFYPFNSELENINDTDLKLLYDVAEGWYIDYKSQGLKIDDFARHLAAFANQYGGWLIIGISEKHDHSRTAGSFTGINKCDIENISRNIREASSMHVNPSVLYEEKTIYGPINSIGLEEDKAIIIIGIPASNNTPHIHSSGRIYRRLADQSKPKEESDRFILDELWRRGEKHRTKLIKLLTSTPILPKLQSDSSWIYVYYKPSETQSPPSLALTFETFSNIVRNNTKLIKGVNIAMQSVHSTENGFIARHIEKNDPSLATLTMRLWHDGTARFDIPLNKYDNTNIQQLLQSNNHIREYLQIATAFNYKNINVIDYTIFFQVLAALTNTYIHILNSIEDTRDIYSNFIIKNVHHTSPYVDSARFIEQIREFSLPLTIENSINYPSEPTDQTMIYHPYEMRKIDYTNEASTQSGPFLFSFPVVYKIFESVGLVNSIDELTKDTESWGFSRVTYS